MESLSCILSCVNNCLSHAELLFRSTIISLVLGVVAIFISYKKKKDLATQDSESILEEINSLKESIKEINVEVNEMQIVNAMKKEIEKYFSISVEKIEPTIELINDYLTTLNLHIQNFTTTFNDYKEKIEELKQKLEENKKDCTEQKKLVQTKESEIKNLKRDNAKMLKILEIFYDKCGNNLIEMLNKQEIDQNSSFNDATRSEYFWLLMRSSIYSISIAEHFLGKKSVLTDNFSLLIDPNFSKNKYEFLYNINGKSNIISNTIANLARQMKIEKPLDLIVKNYYIANIK